MNWGSVFRWALVSRNYAGAEPVTGLKCTHRSCCTRTDSWRCRISPPAPWDSRHHWPQNTSGNWTRSLACIKPTWTFFKYLAQIFRPSSQSLRSDYPAICFYCLLLTSQFIASLYVLRRFAALGLEGLLFAFRTFSVTLLRFLLSDPSLDPESDEVFSFSLLLGFSVVFAKLPEGAKTEIGSK